MISATKTLSHQQVKDHYNDLDELYRSLWGHHLHHGLWLRGDESASEATIELIRRVAVAAGLKPDQKICDIGCGYGATSELLAETYEASVTGVTITPRQYERAQFLQPLRGQVEFRLEDWLENTLASGHYDAAIAIESSEHATDKKKYFQQAYRVLKPGGTLAVCAWMSSATPNLIEKKLLLTPICNEGRMPSLCTLDEYVEILEKNGFEVMQCEDLTEQVKKTWLVVIKNMLSFFISNPNRFVSAVRATGLSRDFLWTPLRMWIAYQTKALRYVLVSSRKKSQINS